MTRGAIYYAVRSPKYVRMAMQSVKSLRRHMPSLPITLFTDLPECAGIKRRWLDSVVEVPPVSQRECHKLVTAVAQSPYDVSLFLGADVWVCGDLTEILDAVEYSPLDFMATLVQQHRYVYRLDPVFEGVGVPKAYPRYESGIIGIERNHRTGIFLRRWREWYDRICEGWDLSPVCPDQPALRVAMHKSPSVRVGALRDCYNYQLWGFFNRPIKTIHAKATEAQFREWEKEANKFPNLPRYMRAGKCIAVIDQ